MPSAPLPHRSNVEAAALLCRAGASVREEVVSRQGYSVTPLEAALLVPGEGPRWELLTLLLEVGGWGSGGLQAGGCTPGEQTNELCMRWSVFPTCRLLLPAMHRSTALRWLRRRCRML